MLVLKNSNFSDSISFYCSLYFRAFLSFKFSLASFSALETGDFTTLPLIFDLDLDLSLDFSFYFYFSFYFFYFKLEFWVMLRSRLYSVLETNFSLDDCSGV